jgi:hypothetical protein
MMCAPKADAATWSNNDATYPPGATQNWNLDGNWNPAVPNGATAIINYGSALIETTVPNITSFLIGNSANANLTRSLYIASGGSLNVTDTTATAFRLYNTAGTHQVTVASGGSLSVAGTLANGAGSGSASIFRSAGTVSVKKFTTAQKASTLITGGTTTIGSDGMEIGGTIGTFEVAGGSVTCGASLTIKDNGTLRLSGGSLGVTGGSGLFIWGSAAAAPRVIHVNGSGASSITLSGLRYYAQVDRDNALWRFTLDNGVNHIAPVTLTANGNNGATLRTDTTLDVRLRGGVLLSGTATFTLVDRPSTETDVAWGTGPGTLWTDTTADDGGRNKIRVTLAAAANKGTLSRSASVTGLSGATKGYVALSGVVPSEPLEIQLDLAGGTLSEFTAALTSAGVAWQAGKYGYDVSLTLAPSVSGASYFAWNLEDISSGMTVQAVEIYKPRGTFISIM